MNLDQYTHGRLLSKLYKLDQRYYNVEALAQPYYPDKREIGIAKRAIINNRAKPIIYLQGYGIVAGVHTLEAYKKLGYSRVPVLLGKLK